MSKMLKMYYAEMIKDGLLNYQKCDNDENQKFYKMNYEDLPDDIEPVENSCTEYIRYTKSELSDEQIKIYYLSKLNKNIKVIKYCVIIFTVLSIMGFILGLLIAFHGNTIATPVAPITSAY